MTGWIRLVLHPSTLHSKYREGYIKMVLETDTLLPDNLAFIYIYLSHTLVIFNPDNPTVLPQVDHSDKGVNSPSGLRYEKTRLFRVLPP